MNVGQALSDALRADRRRQLDETPLDRVLTVELSAVTGDQVDQIVDVVFDWAAQEGVDVAGSCSIADGQGGGRYR